MREPKLFKLLSGSTHPKVSCTARALHGLGYPWGSMDLREFGWIWVNISGNCGLDLGMDYGMRKSFSFNCSQH